MIYYVDGQFGSRKGVTSARSRCTRPGCRTARSRAWPRVARSTETEELAVMCDTFQPLRLTTLARDLDDGKYALSWYEAAEAPA